MKEERMLPIGVQSFEKLRESGFLYVDKTCYIHALVRSGGQYFLSRPRRFGKSLFLSTLKAYWEGKRELFEGLEIAELEKDREGAFSFLLVCHGHPYFPGEAGEGHQTECQPFHRPYPLCRYGRFDGLPL